MVKNFEEHTFELTEEEKLILPNIISGFKRRRKDCPIKAADVVKNMNHWLRAFHPKSKMKMSEVRLRKMVNHIRTNSIIPLIATSKGYFCSYDQEDIDGEIKSLEQRARSIQRCADGLKKII